MNVTVVELDATWVNPAAVQYNAQELRRAVAPGFNGDGSALGVRGGIVRHGDSSLAVTVSASDQLTVQPGPVVVPGNAGTANGCYCSSLGAPVSGVTLEARNATLPRMDVVVYRQLDTDVVAAHGAFTGRIEVLTGTPNATPVNGAQLPLSPLQVELTRITVPAVAGGNATVDNTFRTYAVSPGALLPVPTAARLPAAAAIQDRAFALDTGIQYVWSGTRWVDQSLSFITATAAGSDNVGTVTQIPGLSVNKPGGPETTFIVDIDFDMSVGAANTQLAGMLYVDGVQQPTYVVYAPLVANARAYQRKRWVIRGLADNAAHVFSARVQRVGGSGTGVAYQFSTMSVETRTSV